MEKVKLQWGHLAFRYMGQDPALPRVVDVGWYLLKRRMK